MQGRDQPLLATDNGKFIETFGAEWVQQRWQISNRVVKVSIWNNFGHLSHKISKKNLKFVKQIETSTTLASDAPVPRLLTTH